MNPSLGMHFQLVGGYWFVSQEGRQTVNSPEIFDAYWLARKAPWK